MRSFLRIPEILWLGLIMGLSTGLGVLYSICNIDPHHWGFIVGTALEAIQGKKFFSEIYIQYGVGQPLLLQFLHFFIPIHYTSVGVITSFVYALELGLIYWGARKIANALTASLITALAYLVHSYAIYPWPDYYAGFSLCLSCAFLIPNQESKIKSFSALKSAAAGFALFGAFLFRETYLVGMGVAIFGYLVFALFKKDARNRSVLWSVFTFVALILSYLSYLYFSGTFSLWYRQGIGASTEAYGVNASSVLELLKSIFLPPYPLLPNNVVTTSVSGLVYLGVGMILFLFFGKRKKDLAADPHFGIYVFIAMLGLVGVAQSLKWYQVFRLQNACAPLYFVLAYLIQYYFPKCKPFVRMKVVPLVIIFFLVNLALKFPHASSIYPFFQGPLESYSDSKVELFSGHRFQASLEEYYGKMSAVICAEKKMIVNRTMDSTLPYLCGESRGALMLPFFYEPLLHASNALEMQRFEKGEYHLNEVIIADSDFPLAAHLQLLELARLKPPALVMFGYKDPVRVYSVIPKN